MTAKEWTNSVAQAPKDSRGWARSRKGVYIPFTSNSDENVTARDTSGSEYPLNRVMLSTTLPVNAVSSIVNDN